MGDGAPVGLGAGAGEAAGDGSGVLALYDRGLADVYGYLVRRCGSGEVAEDLTSETFLAAVALARRGGTQQLTVAWLMTVARNKLVDHWRREARAARHLAAVADLQPDADEGDGADVLDGATGIDEERALHVLQQLGAHHRAALTLRYLDGLSVPHVAAELGRTVHATEALLMRAKRAFRTMYAAVDEGRPDHGGDGEGGERP